MDPAGTSFLRRPWRRNTALALLALSLASCTVAPSGGPGYRSGPNRVPMQLVDRMDAVVTFTHQQKAQVVAILEKEMASQQEAPSSRDSRGLQLLGPEALAQIRAVLTPEQQTKFDANPTGIPDLAVQAYILKLIETSPGIAAQVGQVQAVRLLRHHLRPFAATRFRGDGPNPDEGFGLYLDGEERAPVYQEPIDDAENGQLAGVYVYQVQGSTASERFYVTWERPSRTAKVRIQLVTGDRGEAIKL
jgi:Spy/CpxP family protein refolding chaperone